MEVKSLLSFSNAYSLILNSLRIKSINPNTTTLGIKQNIRLKKENGRELTLQSLNGKLLDLKNSSLAIARSKNTVFGQLKVVSSNSQVVSATVAIGAEKKTYEVSISNIAHSQVNWSFTLDAIIGDTDVDEDTVLTGVSGTLTINDKDISIGVAGETDTLENIMNKINETDDIYATALIAGGRLVITCDSPLSTSMTITDSTTGGAAGGPGGLGLSRSANSGSSDTTAAIAQSAQDASFTVAERQINNSFIAQLISGDSNATANTTLNTLGGTLTINYQEFTMGVVGQTDTLNSIKKTINDAEIEVRATVENNRLVLTADSTTENYFIIDDRTTGGLSGTGGLGLTRGANYDSRDLSAGLVQAAGGTSTFTRASNEVGDAIPNLTLTLKSPSSTDETGTAFTELEVLSPTLKLGPNTDKVANIIATFVNDYNSVITELNKLISGKATKDSYKPFLGHANLKKYRDTLFSTVATPVKSNNQTIYVTEIGTEINPDLTFTVDKDKVKAAITLNLSRIESLFSDSSDGIAVRTNALLRNIFQPNRTNPSGVKTEDTYNSYREEHSDNLLVPEEVHDIDLLV